MLLYALNTFGRTLTSLYAKTTQNAASIKHNKDAKSHTKVDSQNRFEFSRPMFFWCDHQIREKARRSAKLTWPHFSNSHVRQNQETYLSRDAFQVSLPKAYFRYFLNVFKKSFKRQFYGNNKNTPKYCQIEESLNSIERKKRHHCQWWFIHQRFHLWRWWCCSVWPDWAINWTLSHFLKHLATINLPKSPTFLGNFCKGVKIYHFSSEIVFGQLL